MVSSWPDKVTSAGVAVQDVVPETAAFRCQQCECGRGGRSSAACPTDLVAWRHLQLRPVCVLRPAATRADTRRLWERHYREYRHHAEESRLCVAGRRLVTGRCYVRPPGTDRSLDLECGNGWYLAETAAPCWEVTGHERGRRHANAVR